MSVMKPILMVSPEICADAGATTLIAATAPRVRETASDIFFRFIFYLRYMTAFFIPQRHLLTCKTVKNSLDPQQRVQHRGLFNQGRCRKRLDDTTVFHHKKPV